MTKFYACILLCFLGGTVLSEEWGQVESSLGQNSVQIVGQKLQLGLEWHDKVVPGDELLLIKSTHQASSFYATSSYAYEFAGVISNAMQINVTGRIQKQGQSINRKDKSREKTLFVERASDGAFYFIAPALKDKATIRIKANPEQQESYLVTFLRSE